MTVEVFFQLFGSHILFIIGLAVFLALAVPLFKLIYRIYRRHYFRLPTFDNYKKEYPKSVINGKVKCHSCGGTHIQFKGLAHATDRRKTHLCVTCGLPLYRSRH